MAICHSTIYWCTLRRFKFLPLLTGNTVDFFHQNTRSDSTKALNSREYKSKAKSPNQLWTRWSNFGDSLKYLVALNQSLPFANRHVSLHQVTPHTIHPSKERCGADRPSELVKFEMEGRVGPHFFFISCQGSLEGWTCLSAVQMASYCAQWVRILFWFFSISLSLLLVFD